MLPIDAGMLPITPVSFKMSRSSFVSFKEKDSGRRPVRPQILSIDNSLRLVRKSIEVGIGPSNEFGPSLSDSREEACDIALEMDPPKEFAFK